MAVLKIALLIVLCAPLYLVTATAHQPTSQSCPVTQPNRHPHPDGSEELPPGSANLWYGNSFLGTTLWPKGNVVFQPGGPGTVLPDGALRMKFLWLKTPGTRLSVTGYRLDDPSVVLRSQISPEYDNQGIQPSYLIFATPGCWQVTATAGGGRLSFITAVTRIGEG